jgi:hypothetical protein
MLAFRTYKKIVCPVFMHIPTTSYIGYFNPQFVHHHLEINISPNKKFNKFFEDFPFSNIYK